MTLKSLGCKLCLYINAKDPKVVTVALKKGLPAGRQGGKVIKSLSEENEYGSQVLLPLILKLLQLARPAVSADRQAGGPRGLDILEGIEVEEGPGSFTGLRVGASVAQALSFALNIPVNGQIGKILKLRYT